MTGSRAVGRRPPPPVISRPWVLGVKGVFFFFHYYFNIASAAAVTGGCEAANSASTWKGSMVAVRRPLQAEAVQLGLAGFVIFLFLVTDHRPFFPSEAAPSPCRAEWPVWQPRGRPPGQIWTAVGFTDEIFFFMIFLPFDIHRYSLQHCCACTQCKREMYIHLRHN